MPTIGWWMITSRNSSKFNPTTRRPTMMRVLRWEALSVEPQAPVAHLTRVARTLMCLKHPMTTTTGALNPREEEAHVRACSIDGNGSGSTNAAEAQRSA